MKICNRCKIEKNDYCFRPRLDKRDGRKFLNNECTECDKDRAAIYYSKKKDDPEFKKKNRLRQKEYLSKNVDQVKARRKLPEYLKKHAAWENARYHRISDRVKAKMKIKRQTPEYKKMMNDYRNKNKEKIYTQEVITKRRYQDKHVQNITDEYIIRKLIDQGVATRESVTPEFILAKRLTILIKRQINNYGN